MPVRHSSDVVSRQMNILVGSLGMKSSLEI